jgi:hypothetical protein
MLSASQKVWFRADSSSEWLKGEVKGVAELAPSAAPGARKPGAASATKRAEFTIELQDHEGNLTGDIRNVISSRVEGSFEEYDLVKPRNKEDDELNGAEAVEDLISLHHLHEPAILSCLQKRFEQNIVYTNTGPILIAVVSACVVVERHVLS